MRAWLALGRARRTLTPLLSDSRGPCHADFLGDTNTASALDVVFFVREIMETNAKLRPTILARLLDSFKEIRSSRVCSCALWIVGEYCTSKSDIDTALEVRPPRCSAAAHTRHCFLRSMRALPREGGTRLQVINVVLGPLPFLKEEDGAEEAGGGEVAQAPVPVISAAHRPAVLADGSYASQTALADNFAGSTTVMGGSIPNLRCARGGALIGCRICHPRWQRRLGYRSTRLVCRTLLLSGDFFLGGVVSAALTKLLLRLRKLDPLDAAKLHRTTAESMLVVAGILRLGENPLMQHPIDADSGERVPPSSGGKPEHRSWPVRKGNESQSQPAAHLPGALVQWTAWPRACRCWAAAGATRLPSRGSGLNYAGIPSPPCSKTSSTGRQQKPRRRCAPASPDHPQPAAETRVTE